jgi:flagellar assembly factor FliW
MIVAVPDIPAIELVHPLPGFPDQRRFALVQLDDDGLLCQLRSLDDPSLRFLVMPPVPFFPDYAPVVSDDIVADLEITSADDVIVLLVLNAGDSLDTTTANLMAPVVVNTVTLRASQVILDDPTLPLAAPLVA